MHPPTHSQLGILWIVVAHFAVREPMAEGSTYSYTQSILAHTHVSVTIFIILSGFSMQWAHASFSPFAKRYSSEAVSDRLKRILYELAHWYSHRLAKLVLLTWISIAWTMALEWSLYDAWKVDLPYCLTFLEFWRIGSSGFTDKPAPAYCPNTPAWWAHPQPLLPPRNRAICTPSNHPRPTT